MINIWMNLLAIQNCQKLKQLGDLNQFELFIRTNITDESNDITFVQ